MSSTETITTLDDGGAAEDSDDQGLSLLIMSPEAFACVPLPAAGSVVIGRSNECEVQLEDGRASRRHARLWLGERLAVEDLGSANGTRVREQAMERGGQVNVSPGETIGIGSTVLVLQRERRSAWVRRLWSHRYFEERLRDQCERGRTLGTSFTVVRLHLERPAAWPRVLPLLARDLPPPHVFAAYGPDEFELLLLEPAECEIERLVETVRTSLRHIGVPVRVGMARYPRDGRSADALLDRANALLRPREPGVPLAVARRDAVSTAMKAAYDLATRAAQANINVLLLGETGVGKEVMARTIHHLSARAGKGILTLNCAGLTESLIESELFGHEKGAFTGAVQAKKGLLEAADGGTVFLDEIGELPVPIQARLLRVIETREILPVGSIRPRRVDVRFIAATNRELEAEVIKGTFRQDLFFRLNGLSITVPPLRDRRSEITVLARTFLQNAAADRPGRRTPSLSAAALKALDSYHWPGNVRELKNVIERALVLCDGDTIDLGHLPVEQLRSEPPPSGAARAAPAGGPTRRDELGLTPEAAADRKRMLDALEACTWNQSRAAKLLGMPRRTFVAKLTRYRIPRPKKRREDPATLPEK